MILFYNIKFEYFKIVVIKASLCVLILLHEYST